MQRTVMRERYLCAPTLDATFGEPTTQSDLETASNLAAPPPRGYPRSQPEPTVTSATTSHLTSIFHEVPGLSSGR